MDDSMEKSNSALKKSESQIFPLQKPYTPSNFRSQKVMNAFEEEKFSTITNLMYEGPHVGED